MGSWFPLHIFPQGSLSSSVITTVWVGIFVVAFFNLRFGWVLSGLVIPGYLAPLLLLKPWAVVAIFVEGMTAYSMVWVFSQYLSKFGWWSALFGRDRFFGLVLASIITRVVFDAWVLPMVGERLGAFGIVFDYRNELHSLGLVIVALIANQFWKTGILKGLKPTLVILFVTWFIVKYVLLEWTNFSLSNLSYMYEDMAVSILASPKAYIILVITALVASRMNLKYGWDFNGILIPALLALQWYNPSKIVISFVEAFIILGLSTLVLKNRFFANTTMEGARKLLLFFNIGFVYKILLAYSMIYLGLEVKTSDYFAFGYLLSTLLAIKMHEKGIAIRMTRATLQVSLVSISIASLLGFTLTLIPSMQTWNYSGHIGNSAELNVRSEHLNKIIASEKPKIYGTRFKLPPLPLPQDIDQFNEGVKWLLKYSRTKEPSLLELAISNMSQLGFQVELIEKQYLFISESVVKKSPGFYVFNLNAENELLIEVPAPLQEIGLIDGAVSLFSNLKARSFSIAGSEPKNAPSQTYFDNFHRIVGRHNVLQIEAYTAEINRSLVLLNGSNTLDKKENNVGELWVKNRLPAHLDLKKLQNILGEYEIHWGQTNFSNNQRDESSSGFAELIVNKKGLRRLLISDLLEGKKTSIKSVDQRIEGYLQEWLLGGKGEIANSGTNVYVTPRPEQLLFFDEEIITPLIQLVQKNHQKGVWKNELLEDFQSINNSAQVFGYELLRYHHIGTDQDYIILYESEKKQRRFWGTYVFRMGDDQPFVIQSPRPLFEVNSFEVAVSLFERLQAKALLIGGTHPLTNQDYSSDLVRTSNQKSVFTLVNQVIMRESKNNDLLAIQCRALGQELGESLPDADMLLSFDDGAMDSKSYSSLQKMLLDSLKSEHWNIGFVDGSLESSGYQVGGTPQGRYVSASTNKAFALLWVSPLVRSSYRQQQDDDTSSLQFLALGIETLQSDLIEVIKTQAKERIADDERGLKEFLTKYIETQDVVILKWLKTQDPKLNRVIDKHTKQAFVLVHNAKGRLVMLGNLNPLETNSQIIIPIERTEEGVTLDPKNHLLNEYIETRTSLLFFNS